MLKYVNPDGSDAVIRRPDWMLIYSPAEISEGYHTSVEAPICKTTFLEIVDLISTRKLKSLAGIDNIAQDAKQSINNMILNLGFILEPEKVPEVRSLLEDARESLKDHLISTILPEESSKTFLHHNCASHCIPFAFSGEICTGIKLIRRYIQIF
jgi:hypothetical protein